MNINTVTTENIENNPQNVTEDNSVQEAWKRQIDKVTKTNINSKHSFAQVTENDLHVVPETESEDISGSKDPKETDTELVNTQDLIPSTNPSNIKQEGALAPIGGEEGDILPIYIQEQNKSCRMTA